MIVLFPFGTIHVWTPPVNEKVLVSEKDIFGINRNWTKNVKQVEQNYEDINLINPKENYEFNISNKLRLKNTIKKLFNLN